MLEDDHKYIWHPFSQMKTDPTPIPVVKGQGAQLIDENGKVYIDANSSWWVNVHGHGHPHIAQAIKHQFEQLDHVIFAGVTHQPAVEMSRRLLEWFQDEQARKVFFSDNGSTATEVALKMSFQYWFNKGENRRKIIAFEGAYHGDTFGAMSVGERDLFNKPFEPFFFDVDYIPIPTQDNFETIKKQMRNIVATGEVAAFIFEPLVQGASGMRMYTPEQLKDLIKIAQQEGVLTIADEVMTGFGRLGKMFAMDYLEQYADMMCFSKGITGGVLPIGITVATEEIYQAFWDDSRLKAFLHGHSFTGNPLACAAVNVFFAVTSFSIGNIGWGLVGVALAGTGAQQGDRSKGVTGIVVNCMTPETETTCRYYWGMVRNFDIDDNGLTQNIKDAQAKVFYEDLEVVEGQQANMLRHPERKLLNFNIDAGGVRARRLIDRALAAAAE